MCIDECIAALAKAVEDAEGGGGSGGGDGGTAVGKKNDVGLAVVYSPLAGGANMTDNYH